MRDILQACSDGMDLLTVWLVFIGYEPREIAALMGCHRSSVTRRLRRIRERMREDNGDIMIA